jgi:arabinan endo-1,5-alpha-L-arabinosidase
LRRVLPPLSRLTAALALAVAAPLAAERPPIAQQLTFTPYHASGIYEIGETVGWTVTPGPAPPADAYKWTIRRNNAVVLKEGRLDLSSGKATIEIAGDQPEMLYVAVEAYADPPSPDAKFTGGNAGRDTGFYAVGAAVAPAKIPLSIPRPADFDAFWDGKLAAQAKVPINPVLTPVSTDVAGVELNMFQLDALGSHAHGYVAKPAREGKFPAVIQLQYAGVYALNAAAVARRASEGWLILNVDSHDKLPSDPAGSVPRGYQAVGNTDRETSYFLDMYLRDSRVLDYLLTRPDWDGRTIVVMGGSMGGQQSIVLAGLRPEKITSVLVCVPAGADSNGDLHGRKAGYPNWPSDNADVMKTALYFDTVNFASRIKAPVFAGFGFIDTISPPAGVWTMLNQIPSPVEPFPMIDSEHDNLTPDKARPCPARSAEILDRIVHGGAFVPGSAPLLPGLNGEIGMHDPSTVVPDRGKFFVYATGNGLPAAMSIDGWTWQRAGSLMQSVPGGRPGPDVISRGGNNTWAPDVIHVGDKFFIYYAAPGTQPKAAIGLLVGRTLDPESPEYAWEDGGPVVWSDGVEDSNAIDPGVLLDPSNGSLWLTYGSYFGYIRLVELDPRTGKRLHPDAKPIDLAVNGEASVMIAHDGWYYLFVTHGSCCAGANSSYNIRMGRAKKVTGPFLDNMGVGMLEGGGKLFLGSGGRRIGPGHFGLLDLGDGVQKFSCHYEADLDRGGISVLDIRPLLWRDGWPVAGDNFAGGTYEIESARTGTALELAVQGAPVGGARRPGGRGGAPAPIAPVPNQDAGQVAGSWPSGPIDLRLSPYMLQAQQKWTVSPVAAAGGYPGSPYFKITVAGTDRTLAATQDGELVALPVFTGGPEQLWRIDQLADGTYRVMPKAVPHATDAMALSAVGSSAPTLARVKADSDRQRWLFKTP